MPCHHAPPDRPEDTPDVRGPLGEQPGAAPGAWPFLSVLVPCRNEEPYIGPCLTSILASDYPPERMEVIVVDGMSDDGTRAILARYAARHPGILVLDNPQRTAAAALNAGIRRARGDVIARVDAHATYQPGYLSMLVRALAEHGADNAGGVMETVPAGDGAVARAIAVALSHRFGVGNARFRIGTTTPRWVDTVAFGCFRRAVFERVGLFDEELVRDHDEEFNYRLIRHGGRVLLLPGVKARYTARRSLPQLWRMYFQYGYFKPLVARKVGRVMTVRQLVPATFVASLIATALLGVWLPLGRVLCAGVAGSYAAAVLGCAVLAARKHGPRCAAALVAVFPVLHVGYGLGFLRGVVDHVLRPRKRAADLTALPLSR